MNVWNGSLLCIFQTDTPPQGIPTANLDPSAENASSGGFGVRDFTLIAGKDMRVMKEKFVPLAFKY